MQTAINSGAAAHALARHILATIKDDPSAEGLLLTQSSEEIYVAGNADAGSVIIRLDGELDWIDYPEVTA